jgi:hypothetical protein
MAKNRSDRHGNGQGDRPRNQDRGGDRRAAPSRASKPRREYWRPSADSTRRQMSRSRAGGGGEQPFKGMMFKPKSGGNTIRILPPTWPNPDHYAMEVWEHRFVGPDEGNYACLRKMKNEACAICDAEKAARSHGDTDEAKALKVRKRWVCYILHRDADERSARVTPMIFDMDVFRDEEIVGRTWNRRDDSSLPVSDPHEGYDLYFRKTGQGKEGTRYGNWEFDRDPSPISDNPKVMNQILTFIEENPLDQVLLFHENEYLESMIFGTAERSDDDDIGTDPKQDEEDEQDEEQQEEEEQEEEEEEQQEEEQQEEEQQEEDEQEEEQQEASEDDDGEPDIRQQKRRPERQQERRQERRELRSDNKRDHDDRSSRRERPPFRGEASSRQRPRRGGGPNRYRD